MTEMFLAAHVCCEALDALDVEGIFLDPIRDLLERTSLVRRSKTKHPMTVRRIIALVLRYVRVAIAESKGPTVDTCVAAELVLTRHHITMTVLRPFRGRALHGAVVVEFLLFAAIWTMKTGAETQQERHADFDA